MDLNQLTQRTKKARFFITNAYNKLPSVVSDANNVEDFIHCLDNLKDTIDLWLLDLRKFLKCYNLDKIAPKRAKARDLCDKILRPLDAVRDVLQRSIEGDDDVVCNEEDAESVSVLLEAVTSFLPQISNLTHVKRGGKQDEDNDA